MSLCTEEEEVYFNEFEHYCVTGATLRAIMTKEKYHIDVNRCENSSYILCCRYGNLAIAKWIYSLDPSRVKPEDQQLAYQYAIKYGHHAIANWICSIVKEDEELMNELLHPTQDLIGMFDSWFFHQQYCPMCSRSSFSRNL